MEGIIRTFTLLFTAMVLAACSASEQLRIPEHLDINSLVIKKTRYGHVVENIIEIQSGRSAHGTWSMRAALLAASQSEQLSINIFSPDANIASDPTLIDLAMNQMQQDWHDLENKYTGNPISIVLWIAPEGESFKHENKIKIRGNEPLHLTFAVSPASDKPAIDILANAVDTVSHELYHVSRIAQSNDNVRGCQKFCVRGIP